MLLYVFQRDRDGNSSRFVHSRETIEDLSEGDVRSGLAQTSVDYIERIIPVNAIIKYAKRDILLRVN